MTVIQKSSRAEMVRIIQRRYTEEYGDEWVAESIYRQIILLEALGLITFPNDRKPESVKLEAARWLSEPELIHSAAMLGADKLNISGNLAVALLEILERGGFKIVRT